MRSIPRKWLRYAGLFLLADGLQDAVGDGGQGRGIRLKRRPSSAAVFRKGWSLTGTGLPVIGNASTPRPMAAGMDAEHRQADGLEDFVVCLIKVTGCIAGGDTSGIMADADALAMASGTLIR